MATPTTMSAVLLTGHGGPENLEFKTDVEVPKPGPGEVLIRVAAAGVNNTDINTRIGWYSKGDGASEDASWAGKALDLPLIQGADVCGKICALGEGVDASRMGERVLIEPSLQYYGGKELENTWYIGSECNGGFAQYVCMDERQVYRIQSEALTDVELASFPCSYSTAENMLNRCAVKEGETVLVTGASGGVGSAAVQLAKARGAHVIAVSSASKFQGLTDIGADQVIDRSVPLTDSLPKNSVDVVIDLVAGPTWPQLIDLLKPRGRYAVSGAIGGAHVNLDVRNLYLKDLKFFGCTRLDPEVFGNLVSLIEQGRIKPLVAQEFELQDIAKAQEAFQNKNFLGKIVLRIP